ncbi:MAG TPA: GNAT family N-acetyltransferase [Aggregatilineales bacterium]|nr:GNAT family N-acetyltransferase [Aggregatilineales bacterium]
MTAPVQLIPSNDIEQITQRLREADEDVSRIRELVSDRAHHAYLAVLGDVTIGAVLMRWEPDASEILYIAIDTEQQGRGYGKAVMAAVIGEAQQRGMQSVVVGTSNASLSQIAFYQKFGFRVDSVRRDYFDYLSSPAYENGIQIRDMLVLRYEIGN